LNPSPQAVAWVGCVTPQQMVRLCVRAFPFAPTGDELLDHLMLASEAAGAADAAEARGAAPHAWPDGAYGGLPSA
jgi:hypothetical protein